MLAKADVEARERCLDLLEYQTNKGKNLMILIESFNKRINYFGVELLVHNTIKYIATDASGLVKGYTKCPQYKANRWAAANGTTVYIGRVNLKFQPASSTLMEL